MDQVVSVKLGGREFEVHRARLGLYLDIAIVASRLERAVQSEDNGRIVQAVFDYILLCIPELNQSDIISLPWFEIVNALVELVALNTVKKEFAILKHTIESGLPPPWDYPERIKTAFVHTIARAYHWTKENIESMTPEDGIAFFQEIQADEQADREFLHSLSEIAYPYSESTKKQRYVPMQRPLWMVAREDLKQVQVKMRRDMMPVGKIIHLDGSESEEILH